MTEGQREVPRGPWSHVPTRSWGCTYFSSFLNAAVTNSASLSNESEGWMWRKVTSWLILRRPRRTDVKVLQSSAWWTIGRMWSAIRS